MCHLLFIIDHSFGDILSYRISPHSNRFNLSCSVIFCLINQPPFGDRDRVETKFFKEPLGVLEVPFSRPTDLKRRVYLLSNPCMFRVNELLFGVCSNDTLFSLSSDETSANLGVNRLARLSGHMLLQQSFSPQFPAPSSALAQV